MDTNPNTQCTSACGNDYDCPHDDDSETEAMTRLEQLDLIRAACIEANPTDTTLRDKNSWQGLQIKREYGRPIRLADVLLAIPTLWVQPKTDVGNGTRFINSGIVNSGISWNLRRDDLAEQSDECVAFLENLLG